MTPVGERCDAGSVQDEGNRIADVKHNIPDRAGIFVRAIRTPLIGCAASTGDGSERPIKDPYDLASGDFFRRAGQMIPTSLAFFAR